MFECVFDSVDIGELHFPHNVCTSVLEKEVQFWGYELKDLAACCLDRVLKGIDENETGEEIRKQWNNLKQNSQTSKLRIDTHIPRSVDNKKKCDPTLLATPTPDNIYYHRKPCMNISEKTAKWITQVCYISFELCNQRNEKAQFWLNIWYFY